MKNLLWHTIFTNRHMRSTIKIINTGILQKCQIKRYAITPNRCWQPRETIYLIDFAVPLDVNKNRSDLQQMRNTELNCLVKWMICGKWGKYFITTKRQYQDYTMEEKGSNTRYHCNNLQRYIRLDVVPPWKIMYQ